MSKHKDRSSLRHKSLGSLPAKQLRYGQKQVAKHNPYNPNIEKIMERLASSSLFGSDTSLGAKIILALMINELFINVANNVKSSTQPKTSPKRSEKKEQKRAEAEQKKTVAEQFQEFASDNLSQATQNEVLDNFAHLDDKQQQLVANFANLAKAGSESPKSQSLTERLDNFFASILPNILVGAAEISAPANVANPANDFEKMALSIASINDENEFKTACQKLRETFEKDRQDRDLKTNEIAKLSREMRNFKFFSNQIAEQLVNLENNSKAEIQKLDEEINALQQALQDDSPNAELQKLESQKALLLLQQKTKRDILTKEKETIDIDIVTRREAIDIINNTLRATPSLPHKLGMKYLRNMNAAFRGDEKRTNLQRFHRELAESKDGALVVFDLEEIMQRGNGALIDLLFKIDDVSRAYAQSCFDDMRKAPYPADKKTATQIEFLCKLINTNSKFLSEAQLSHLSGVHTFVKYVLENKIPLEEKFFNMVLAIAINTLPLALPASAIDQTKHRVFINGMSPIDAINIHYFLKSLTAPLKDANNQELLTSENAQTVAVAKFILGAYFFKRAPGDTGDYFSEILHLLTHQKTKGFESIFENYSATSQKSSIYEREVAEALEIINSKTPFTDSAGNNYQIFGGKDQTLVAGHRVFYVVKRNEAGKALALFSIDGNALSSDPNLRGNYHPGIRAMDVSKISDKDLEDVLKKTISADDYASGKRIHHELLKLDPTIKIFPFSLTRNQLDENCTRKSHDLLLKFILNQKFQRPHLNIYIGQIDSSITKPHQASLEGEEDFASDVLHPDIWHKNDSVIPSGESHTMFQKLRSRLVNAALSVVKNDGEYMEILTQQAARDPQKESALKRYLANMVPETTVEESVAKRGDGKDLTKAPSHQEL